MKFPIRFQTLVAGDLGGVDEAGVDPAGHAVLLLPRRVRTLSGLRVVVGPVERHELVPLAVSVEHLVALADGDLVHLDGAARLAGHQDLGGYHLETIKTRVLKHLLLRLAFFQCCGSGSASFW